MNMIKQLREKRKMSQADLAEAVGTSQPQIKRLEAGERKLSLEWANRLAPALGVTPEILMFPQFGGLIGLGAKILQSDATTLVDGLEVLGDIQAGNWMDISLIGDSHREREVVPVARDPRFPNATQYLLRVVGDSMNLKYPEYSYVHCVEFLSSGITKKLGQVVHVERHNGPLVEITLKEITELNGRMVLSPRSSNPKHQPLILDGDSATEIIIKGVVIGRYQREEV